MLNVYLTNKDESYLKEGYKSRLEKAISLANSSAVQFITKGHYLSYSQAKLDPMNLDKKFVFLFRDPRDSILSFFYFTYFRKKGASFRRALHYAQNRQLSNAYVVAKKDYEKINFDEFFWVFAKREIPRWKKFFVQWNGRSDVLTVRYEEMWNDAQGQLSRLAHYMGYSITEEEISASLDKWNVERTSAHFNNGSKVEENMVRTPGHGNWKLFFNDEHNRLFSSAFRDLPDAMYFDNQLS